MAPGGCRVALELLRWPSRSSSAAILAGEHTGLRRSIRRSKVSACWNSPGTGAKASLAQIQDSLFASKHLARRLHPFGLVRPPRLQASSGFVPPGYSGHVVWWGGDPGRETKALSGRLRPLRQQFLAVAWALQGVEGLQRGTSRQQPGRLLSQPGGVGAWNSHPAARACIPAGAAS